MLQEIVNNPLPWAIAAINLIVTFVMTRQHAASADARSKKVELELNEFKIEVARDYVNMAAIDRIERRLDQRFDDVNQRFDDMNERLKDVVTFINSIPKQER